MKRGDRVMLTKEASKLHTCPKGRRNFQSAIVAHVYGEDMDRVDMIDDLRGCRSWNTEDLVLVELAIEDAPIRIK